MSPFPYSEDEMTDFLRQQVPVLLARLDPAQAPVWGLMSAQHMVEHLAGAARLSAGHYQLPAPEPGAQFDPTHARLLADAPFSRHIRNPLLPALPRPLRLPSLAAAAAELLLTMDGFFTYHAQHPAAAPVHPLFGPLSFAEWRVFHFKHFGHHFLQFGLLAQSLLPRPPNYA